MKSDLSFCPKFGSKPSKHCIGHLLFWWEALRVHRV